MENSLNLNERIAFFEENYEILSTGKYGSGYKIGIGKQKNKCRFCGKRDGETTFSNVSHAIPQFLGNKQLILFEECDECNKFFSENLEDHLDKYTKPFRTLGSIKGDKKIPKYRSRDKDNKIVTEGENKFEMHFKQTNSAVVEEGDNYLRIKLDIEPHIPSSAYKALVKIALSLINKDEELSAFGMTIKWLLDRSSPHHMIEPLILMRSFIPGFKPIKNVTTFLLRKKSTKQVPYCLFIIAFGNWIYQLHIPSHLDAGLGKEFTYAIPWFPTEFDEGWPMGPVISEVKNMTSNEKRASTEVISVRFDRKIDVTPV